MKRKSNRLQERVLRRLDAGLPLTRWQRLQLHMQTFWKHRRKQNLHRLSFLAKGILRSF